MRGRTMVRLMHGLRDGDARHFVAELRGLTGHDEALIADAAMLSPAACATAVLARVTQRIGAVVSPSEEAIAGLVIGDRERLLFKLWGMTFGDELDLVAHCPGCGELQEMAVRPGDLPGAVPDAPIGLEHEIRPETADGRWRIRFRLPTGRDQESAARDPDQAKAALIAACVTECVGPDGESLAPQAAEQIFGALLEDAFQRLDPDAEATSSITCGACGHASVALLDGFAILHAGLTRGEDIYRDTYWMSRTYHWSEADILAMPIARRKRYLALAADMAAGA